jgi:DUF3054 family protein
VPASTRSAPQAGSLTAGCAAGTREAALGMILRVVSDQATAVAFIIVALAFLGLFLLGWRLLARVFAR